MICLHVVAHRRDWHCPGLECPCICDYCLMEQLRIYEQFRKISRAPDIRSARARV